MDDSEKKTDVSIVPVSTDATLVASLTHEFDFEGASGATFEAYSVAGKPLAETSTYKVLVVKLPSGQLGLGMVAAAPANNYLVEKQEHILNTLLEMAKAEDEAAKIKPNYGALFPTLVDTFDTGEDDGRAGLVMGFNPAIKEYKQLIPLSVALAGKRVDLQTATWMLSKYLKLLDFVHAQDFAIDFVDETNYLIEPELHGAFVLNWMYAIEDNATDTEKKADTVALAGIVWRAAGGTDKANPPYDEKVMSKDGYDRFVANLKRLMTEPNNAGEEMAALLVLADTIWERVDDPGGYNADGKKRPFHKWVTYPA